MENTKSQDEIDRFWMKKALQLAKKAATQDEVPVGAVLIDHKSNVLISKAHNLRETLHSPLAHAELLVIHRASQLLKSWRLNGHTLYVTLEPCAMCCGAIKQARIDRVVFGAYDTKGGASQDPLFKKSTQFQGSLFEKTSQKFLKDFFIKLRSRHRNKNPI